MVYISPCWLRIGNTKTTTIEYARRDNPNVVCKVEKITNGYGILFPKGVYIHHTKYNDRGMLISKDGIARHIKNGNHLMARFCALLEAVLFLLSIPFMLLVYTLSIIICIIIIGFLMIFGWCIPWNFTIRLLFMSNTEITSNQIFIGLALLTLICSIMSLVYIVMYILLTPFRILIPEFTTWIGEHKWGHSTEFEYFEYLTAGGTAEETLV